MRMLEVLYYARPLGRSVADVERKRIVAVEEHHVPVDGRDVGQRAVKERPQSRLPQLVEATREPHPGQQHAAGVEERAWIIRYHGDLRRSVRRAIAAPDAVAARRAGAEVCGAADRHRWRFDRSHAERKGPLRAAVRAPE